MADRLAEPADEALERAILAACLHDPSALDTSQALLLADDFRSAASIILWNALNAVHSAGHRVDPISVTAELRRAGQLDAVGGGATVAMLSAAGPDAVGGIAGFLHQLCEVSARRNLIDAARTHATAVANGANPYEHGELLASQMGALDRGVATGEIEGLITADELVQIAPLDVDWLIDDLVGRQWRIVVVASEGAGKTVLLRSLAAYAAAGLHPFKPDVAMRGGPRRALVIDLENPDEALQESFEVLLKICHKMPDWDGERLRVLRRPDGVDLRSRAGFALIEAVIQKTRPDLVCIGPAYKMGLTVTNRGETPEEATIEVLMRLDQLRKRHDFALIIEHHAPHGNAISHRELRPYGASAWLRWPDIGLTMAPTAATLTEQVTAIEIGRFRRDRLRNSWPMKIERNVTRLWQETGQRSSRDWADEERDDEDLM